MRFRWLFVLVLLPACEALLGVEFDRAHPAPISAGDADADIDQSTSGGAGGNAGASGSSGAGVTDAGDASDATDGCNAGTACYTGPSGTLNVGVCEDGVIECTDAGNTCAGEVTPAFENTKTIPDESCDTFTGNHLFSLAFGESSVQEGQGVDLDAAGNVFLTGNFSKTFSLGTLPLFHTGTDGGPPPSDIFLAKLKSVDHSVEWAKAFGGVDDELPHALRVDPAGNVVIAGVIQGPTDFGDGNVLTPPAGLQKIFAAKFSTGGTLVWSKMFGSATANENLYGMAIDDSGHVYLVGVMDAPVQFGSTPIINAGSNDAYLVKLDSTTGEPLWSRGFIASGVEINLGVTTAANGRVVVTGTTTTSSAGGLVVAGMPIEGTGSRSFFVVFDETGAPVFSRALGLTGGASGYYEIAPPATDPSGSAIAVATSYVGTVNLGGTIHTSQGLEDILIAKFDAAGTPVWSRSFGGPADEDNPAVVAVDAQGNVIVAGDVEEGFDCGGGLLTYGGSDDMFVVKLSGDDGASLWCRQLGSTALDQAADIAIGPNDEIWLTGEFGVQFDFGPAQLNAPGSAPDGFLIQLAP